MDDTLRPHQSAIRKAAHGVGMHSSTTTSASSVSLADDSEDALSSESHDFRKGAANTGHGSKTSANPVRLPIRSKVGSPSSRRITRGDKNGEKIVDYNMKHHPMDDILRPRQSANRRSAHIAETSPSADSRGPSEHRIDEPRGSETPANRNGIPDAPTRIISAGGVTVIRHDRPRSLDSNQRVTRERNREKPMVYNMKHHPMDTSLRPAQARKQLARWSTGSTDLPLATPKKGHSKVSEEAKAIKQTSPSYSNTVTDSRSAVLTHPSEPAISSPIRPHKSAASPRQDFAGQSVAASWKSLTKEDRSLYVLQQGAPSGGQTLPRTWPDVASALQAEFGASVTTSALQSRYDAVRQSVQNYFGAESDPTKPEDITMRYAEGFDVYDYEPGDKYWRHTTDSVVQPEHLADADANDSSQVLTNVEMSSSQPIPSDHSESFSNEHLESPEKAKITTSHDAKRNVRRKARDISRATKDRVSVRYVNTNDSQSEDEDEIEGRGLNASLNDADAYRRQSTGLDELDDETMDESPEKDIVTTMRGGTTMDDDDLLQPDQLTPEF
ncbi:MAG: hypothetical protein Q9174_003971, partial [Haloplaca sp. 1 TL-2023]